MSNEPYNLKQEIATLREDALRPTRTFGRSTQIWVGSLLVVIAWGVFCYIYQLRNGLGVTAMRDYVSWGLYISTFVFFIGISHSGTLVSAILRITKQEWRRPITRSAELLTFVSLCFGGIQPIIDLGRPDRIMNLVLFGRLQSPLIWDIISIMTYFAGSTVFLFLPMIPDMALCRDSLTVCDTRYKKFKKWLYTFMAIGWTGTKSQWHRLELSMTIMTIVIIPVAVSVHTVVSYIFAMTLRPGWDSTVFGPYFVAGALYSGSACVILGMAAFRKVYHLEKYFTPRHFDLIGRVVLALTLIYAYLNLNEYWIPAYKMVTAEGHLLNDLFYGSYSKVFWTCQFGTVLLPIFIMSFPAGRKITPLVITCIIIAAGAWVKRYLIVVPTLLHPFMPIQEVPGSWSSYFPNYVEFSVTAAGLAGIFLVITLFSKLFPMMAVWEVAEGIEIDHDKLVATELREQREKKEKAAEEKSAELPNANSLLKTTAMVLILCFMFSGTGNAEGTAGTSQGKSETTIGLSYIKKADLSKTAIAIVKAKKGRKFTPANGVSVNFYALHDKDQQLLRSIKTDDKGEARILLDNNLPLDENHAFTIIAKIANDNRYEDAEERMQLKEANLLLVLNPNDTNRLVTVKVTEKGQEGSEIPVKGVELKFYVQRIFGNMPASDDFTVSTDEKGEATFNYPKNIPGDTAGLINLIARMEDNEQFGTVEGNLPVHWGKILAPISDAFPRALWEPYAPLPLVITISVLFGGVWSVYFYLFFQLHKIKKENGLIADNKQKTPTL